MRERLRDAAAALGLTPTPAQLDRLLAYAALLERWSTVYNLTALREPERILSHHLLDCLAAVPPLARHAGSRALKVLDVGSGAGLPGVVIAIMAPDWALTCVDPVAKKIAFIRQAGAELGLSNLRAVHARVEALGPDAGRFDLIISRAFASLSDFVLKSSAVIADGGVWIAMKSRPAPAELSALPPAVDLFHVEQLRVPYLDAQRCLVWMRRQATL